MLFTSTHFSCADVFRILLIFKIIILCLIVSSAAYGLDNVLHFVNFANVSSEMSDAVSLCYFCDAQFRSSVLQLG